MAERTTIFGAKKDSRQIGYIEVEALISSVESDVTTA